jgi:hypothetical protein
MENQTLYMRRISTFLLKNCTICLQPCRNAETGRIPRGSAQWVAEAFHHGGADSAVTAVTAEEHVERAPSPRISLQFRSRVAEMGAVFLYLAQFCVSALSTSVLQPFCDRTINVDSSL